MTTPAPQTKPTSPPRKSSYPTMRCVVPTLAQVLEQIELELAPLRASDAQFKVWLRGVEYVVQEERSEPGAVETQAANSEHPTMRIEKE